MTVDPQVVAELREMFQEGATPSRLIRHIATRHEGDHSWPSRVQAYFWEAFGVVTLAMEGRPANVDPDEIDLPVLDAELLRDMVGRSHLWRDSAVSGPAWWDGLVVSPDDLRMMDGIRPEAHPALKEVWSSLPARAQGVIRQAMVNAQANHERALVLARLAERLQEQVVQLEPQDELDAVAVG